MMPDPTNPPAAQDWMAQPCPKCKAPAGSPCVYLWPKGSATPTGSTHAARKRIAASIPAATAQSTCPTCGQDVAGLSDAESMRLSVLADDSWHPDPPLAATLAPSRPILKGGDICATSTGQDREDASARDSTKTQTAQCILPEKPVASNAAQLSNPTGAADLRVKCPGCNYDMPVRAGKIINHTRIIYVMGGSTQERCPGSLIDPPATDPDDVWAQVDREEQRLRRLSGEISTPSPRAATPAGETANESCEFEKQFRRLIEEAAVEKAADIILDYCGHIRGNSSHPDPNAKKIIQRAIDESKTADAGTEDVTEANYELPPSQDIQEALSRLFTLCGFAWENTTSIDDYKTLGAIDDAREKLEEFYGAVSKADGAALIAAERLRQIEKEGWTREHDIDQHGDDELVFAAIAYLNFQKGDSANASHWPFEDGFKPTDRTDVRNLVKAGALIAAEIDRIRAARKGAL